MSKLSDMAARNAKPKEKPYSLSDGGGLALRISPAGNKSWQWRYVYNGKEQTLTIGKYPLIGLSEARQKRDEARKLLDEGKHPTREQKIAKLRNLSAGENSFEAIARRWLAVKSSKLNKKYAKQTLARMEQHIFPRIGALPIHEITIPDVVAVIEAIAAHGTIETSKRMKQCISQVFRYAAQRVLCEHNPAADLRDILPATEEKHHACIPIEELPALIEKIEARQRDFTYYAMKLLMLTFVRTSELIAARWDEIDWQREEWNIPKERMKMRRPHLVPLSRQALALLKELHEQTGEKEHIFHSPASKSMHISNGTVLMGLRRMGYQNRMTGHGFRTLASTILNEKGYAPDWIERQLAHADSDPIRAAYNRAEYRLERKKMMQEYADWLDGLGKAKNNIITMQLSKS
jgi:integrase